MKRKIKPLTRKLQNKVKEHGPWWSCEQEGATLWLLCTLNGVHNRGQEPYCLWAKEGVDFEFEKE